MTLKKYIITELDSSIEKYSGNRDKIINTVSNQDFYHGSYFYFENFSLVEFGRSDEGWLGYGVYLTNEYDYADSYASDEDEGVVYTCRVNIKNPYILLNFRYSYSPEKLMYNLGVHNSYEITRKLKSRGYDSVLLIYEGDNIDEFIEICVFDPKDITITNIEEKNPEYREEY